MKEKIENKIIVIELANREIVLKNSNNNFDKILINMGFKQEKEYYKLNLSITNIFEKIDLIQKLIDIGALFSAGRDWSPSELLQYYKEQGLLDRDYYEISWKNENEYNINLK